MYGPPGLHLEVKWYKAIAALRFINQATDDAAKTKSGDVPTVLLREDGDKDWYVMVPLHRSEEFARNLIRQIDAVPLGEA